MAADDANNRSKGLNVFEKYLTLWVIVCIGAGIVLGKFAPGFAKALDGMAIYVDDAPIVSIPIALIMSTDTFNPRRSVTGGV